MNKDFEMRYDLLYVNWVDKIVEISLFVNIDFMSWGKLNYINV